MGSNNNKGEDLCMCVCVCVLDVMLDHMMMLIQHLCTICLSVSVKLECLSNVHSDR